MELKLQRFEFEGEATIGRLSIDGEHFCYTLEDEVREVEGQPVERWKVPAKTAVPRGTYGVIYGWSNRFQTHLPRVQNVPGFEGILIHPGNFAKNTEGCILLGDYVEGQDESITKSRATFTEFMETFKAAIDRGETVTLEIS